MDLAARNQEMREFFNEKAEGYDAVHLLMMDNKRAILSHLPQQVGRVLDLGAGTGLELIPLFERYPKVSVTVIDISEEMVAQLRKRDFADRLDILLGDFFSVEFGSGYDAVLSSAALHHFDEPEKIALYRKIFACLCPGGVFVNSDRCAATQEEQDRDFAEYAQDPHRWRHMDTPMTAQNEVRIMEKAGFTRCGIRVLADPRYQVTFGYKQED